MTTYTYTNPIIKGFNPDPSICRVGDDFYLATSTFEFSPGLPVYHSKNLIDWELVSHGLSRPEQMTLSRKIPNAFGLYAPTIREINGRFYMVCTNVADDNFAQGNFLIWTDDIRGEWSDPIWLDTPGIDPSLFVDDDGTVYYSGTHKDIYVRQLNLETGELGERLKVWDGTGAADPEAPHIYKKDGYYYLLIAEGGTSYGHMISMARSKNLTGPYENCPHNPVMTNRSSNLPIQAAGHADLVQDADGKWWAVCLGVRPISYPLRHLLGRETHLMAVDWSGDWPVFATDGHLPLEATVDLPGPPPKGSADPIVDWVSAFEWDDRLIEKTTDGFSLMPNDKKISDQEPMALILQRQQTFDFKAHATLDLIDLSDGEAGITVYLNPSHHYELAVNKGQAGNGLLYRRQIGSLWKVEKEVAYDAEQLRVMVSGDKDKYEFFYLDASDEWVKIGEGETKYVTTEVGGVFTGVFFGFYASSTLDKQVVRIQDISF